MVGDLHPLVAALPDIPEDIEKGISDSARINVNLATLKCRKGKEPSTNKMSV